MRVDERARRLLTDDLLRVHGEEVTDILMAHLPPVGWADVATKQDLGNLATVLRAEMAALRAEFTAELATRLEPLATRLEPLATREELDRLATALRGEMSTLRAEMHGEIAELRHSVATLTRWMMGLVVTTLVGTGAIVVDLVVR